MIDTSWGGWQSIYDEYSEKLTTAGASITYVKEKYGFMKFEADYSDNKREIESLIHEAEERSLKTCQKCGKKAEQTEIGGWIYTLCEDCRRDKEKYDPASIVIPPFERLADNSFPNVHTMLTPEKEEQQRQKIRELLKIPYGIIRKFENGMTLWYEPITDETDGFVLRTSDSPIQTVYSEKREAYILDLQDESIIDVFLKK